MSVQNVLIMGAAGRDFHDFNMFFRNNPDYRVVAFTATQIPDIAGRRYPAALAGKDYPEGIPIYDEKDLESKVVPFIKTDLLFEEVSNLKLKTLPSGALTVEKVVGKLNKDRFSCLAYLLWYILEKDKDIIYDKNTDISNFIKYAPMLNNFSDNSLMNKIFR